MSEKYVPSLEETKKAEEMLSPEEKRLSEKRVWSEREVMRHVRPIVYKGPTSEGLIKYSKDMEEAQRSGELGDSKFSFVKDSKGRIVEIGCVRSKGFVDTKTNYEYHDNDTVKSETYSRDWYFGPVKHKFFYQVGPHSKRSFDQEGREIEEIKYEPREKLDDIKSRLTISYEEGVMKNLNMEFPRRPDENFSVVCEYNEDGTLSEQKYFDHSGEEYAERKYFYDENGHINRINHDVRGKESSGYDFDFEKDASYQPDIWN